MSPRPIKAPSPWATARDKAAEREQKREAVIQTAALAFSENGYHRTSLDQIAERLGVTKPTLYYYARNKEDLLDLVVGRALTMIMDSPPGHESVPGLDQLKQFIRRYAEVIGTDFGRCLAAVNNYDLSPEALERNLGGKRRIDQRIRSLILKGQVDGSIGPCDPKYISFMLAGAVNWIGRWYQEGGEMSAASVGELFANQIAMGLTPRT
ncbi:MAG: TetR family transcriptional regulator [Caulobacter sp.]|nr:TetR family transcriptional regulator [Caulobacter sp.]